MARYSTDHKEKTRAAIVDAAAERIRSGGFDALGVASIMAEAGLTHGGFYAHFSSRDALLAALHELHPAYGFAAHKGYPTAEHLVALRRHGACSAHRRSFAPVRAVIEGTP